MIEKLTKFFFFLLILLIPIQLGKHFWPSFSFVSGIRVDYLSPILYVSDIAVIFLILLFVVSKKNLLLNFNKYFLPYIILFVLVVFLQVFIAKSPLAHLYGILKLTEMCMLGMFVATTIKYVDIGNAVRAFSVGAFFASALGLLQIFYQHSIGGVFYFLGERTFSISTIGIAKMNSFDMQILRPYAAFPHPNVLAFFLFTTIVLLVWFVPYEKNKIWKTFLIVATILSSVALLLTFSRVIIFCFAAFLLHHFVFESKKKSANHFMFYGMTAFCVVFFLSIFYKRFFIFGSDLLYRFDLILISLSILKNNLLFGVGLNNFFIYELPFQKIISPILLQPVHNIYLLVAVQLGLLGSLLPAIFIWKTVTRVWNNYVGEKNVQIKSLHKSLFIILVSLLVIGLFDHFFLTLQQGQIMLALILGLCWANFKTKKLKV